MSRRWPSARQKSCSARTRLPAGVSGQKVCHGGLIFALADSSFGFACNSHNQRAELIALSRGKSATVKGTWIE